MAIVKYVKCRYVFSLHSVIKSFYFLGTRVGLIGSHIYNRNDYNTNKKNTPIKKTDLKNRGKVDILYDILSSALEGGAKKTHIMYRANLSSEQMRFYFHALLSHRLLTVDRDSDDNMIYKTTPKGIKFLQCCTQIKLLASPPTRRNEISNPVL